MKELELSHEDVIINLKQEHDKSITRIRQEYEVRVKEVSVKYERKMKALRDDNEIKRKNEIHEVEERKNLHISDLVKKHDRAFHDIKVYYNDITLNNLELIKALKEQVEELKKKDELRGRTEEAAEEPQDGHEGARAESRGRNHKSETGA
eukprot:TRINITY_DN32607_c0_g1_i1.p1 TRINITY_DN32607_c0_g1~~TRINITY_DN32607_c0_g1_i1.p1  ORF type:complete len:150 (-),score=21.36 TRINITY_DN32607_c0_g1_i1:276-725(-)